LAAASRRGQCSSPWGCCFLRLTGGGARSPGYRASSWPLSRGRGGVCAVFRHFGWGFLSFTEHGYPPLAYVLKTVCWMSGGPAGLIAARRRRGGSDHETAGSAGRARPGAGGPTAAGPAAAACAVAVFCRRLPALAPRGGISDSAGPVRDPAAGRCAPGAGCFGCYAGVFAWRRSSRRGFQGTSRIRVPTPGGDQPTLAGPHFIFDLIRGPSFRSRSRGGEDGPRAPDVDAGVRRAARARS